MQPQMTSMVTVTTACQYGGGLKQFLPQHLCGFTLVGFEGNLQDAVAQGVAIQRLDCNDGLVIVGHRNKAKPFALVGLEVSNDFHTLYCTKRPKQLPQDVLFGLWSKVVYKDAPSRTVHGVAREHGVGEEITSQRRIPTMANRPF